MNGAAKSRMFASLPWSAAAMGFALFFLHLLLNGQYGFHGDELYFVVCGGRPAWGYADHPPFVPLVARLATEIMGVNLFALRFFPALALGVGCALTGWLARRLGAGRFGEFLSAFAFVCAPMLMRLGAFLNIPSFEVVFWLVVAHLLLTLEKRDEPRWWLAIGAVAGLSLLNKHTTLFLGTGLAVGLLLTRRRKDLAGPWPWLGGVLAGLIFLPNLLWQFRHDWATLEFVRAINAGAMQGTPRAEFVLSQFVLMNLFNAFVWGAGLYFYLRDDAGRPYRSLGWVFVTVLIILLAFKSKVYYLLPAYPMLFAAGGVFIERRTAQPPRRLLRASLVVAMGAMALVFFPIMTPVGSVEWKERYIGKVLGFLIDEPSDLTFDFRYQLGRLEELQALRGVYEALDGEAKAACAILADEYDSASNVNVLGRELGLPQAISGNNSYYLWGPQGVSGDCLIVVGYKEELLNACFQDVRVAGRVARPWLRNPERGRPIFVCRNPVEPLRLLWPRFKILR